MDQWGHHPGWVWNAHGAVWFLISGHCCFCLGLCGDPVSTRRLWWVLRPSQGMAEQLTRGSLCGQASPCLREQLGPGLVLRANPPKTQTQQDW